MICDGQIIKVHKLFKGVNIDPEKKEYVTLTLWISPVQRKEKRKANKRDMRG